MMWIDQVSFDERGLIPVVAQAVDTGEVLMLAYANREALAVTLETGHAHYWSRSRSSLWQKGETSGHSQEVEEIRLDCDGDAVLYRVRQTGPACHTQERSCFHTRIDNGNIAPAPEMGDIFSRVEEIVAARQQARPEGSYTTYLFDEGLDKILKKIGEEATEVVIAAKNPGLSELRAEVTDLMYHLLVLLCERGLALRDIRAELEHRFGAPPRQRRAKPAAATESPAGEP
jgi:phosphoribosyl-ATP pyrophosphohydrolase/phosphoribosyl-AMP cyclohydrolase